MRNVSGQKYCVRIRTFKRTCRAGGAPTLVEAFQPGNQRPRAATRQAEQTRVHWESNPSRLRTCPAGRRPVANLVDVTWGESPEGACMSIRAICWKLACLAVVFPTFAAAQATRTWVSGVGDDANPCSRTAPCKTFAGAISKTAAGGEIDTLDAGGFGAVTITKAITIYSDDSKNGGILVAGTNGITVSAGANDV